MLEYTLCCNFFLETLYMKIRDTQNILPHILFIFLQTQATMINDYLEQKTKERK